jgi:hypothetical protein
VFTVDCLTPLTWFSCCVLLSSGALFILVPCCTEVTGWLGLNSDRLAANCCWPLPAHLIIFLSPTELANLFYSIFQISLLELWLFWHDSLCSLIAGCSGDSVLDCCGWEGFVFAVAWWWMSILYFRGSIILPCMDFQQSFFPKIFNFLHNICKVCPCKPASSHAQIV